MGHQDRPDLVIGLARDENFRGGEKPIIQHARIQAAPEVHPNAIDIVSLGTKSETRGHPMLGSQQPGSAIGKGRIGKDFKYNRLLSCQRGLLPLWGDLRPIQRPELVTMVRTSSSQKC